jgi:phosphoribosylformylglycinamidine cyclo-ligase
MPNMSEPITYKDAGVDIDAGNEAVERIKKVLKGTPRKVVGGEEVGGIGGFSGLFRPFLRHYADPLLVSSTDGVGTKLLLALENNMLTGIGQDLVAMIVNDLVVTGARPLFFLDYIATGKLDPAQIETIIKSIQRACEESDCLLVGGECAEMPGMYAPGHTDLAGFGVGIVDRESIIDGTGLQSGDIVLGLASSGFHSNGFSLVRKVIERKSFPSNDIVLDVSGKTVLEQFLEPTRLYVKPLMALFTELGTGSHGSVKACAHVTGGGLIENPARVIPENLAIEIKRDSWPEPAVFQWLKAVADLPDHEMDRTFNRGIGFVVVVSNTRAQWAKEVLEKQGEKVYEIGRIIDRPKNAQRVTII